MSSDSDVAVLGGIFVASQLILPFYNAWLKKREIEKEQTDQFHSRDNHALDEIWQTKVDLAKQEGFQTGYKEGKSEIRAQRADAKNG